MFLLRDFPSHFITEWRFLLGNEEGIYGGDGAGFLLCLFAGTDVGEPAPTAKNYAFCVTICQVFLRNQIRSRKKRDRSGISLSIAYVSEGEYQ